jgi:STE24 endopeptidase
MIELNEFFWIAIGILIGMRLLEGWADWLNLKAMDRELPERVKDIYAEDEYRRSQSYERVKTKWSWISDAIFLVALLGFWLSGGFGWLETSLQSLNWHPVLTGLLYFFLLGLAQWLIRLPFDWHDTFRIEERYGFNRTTQSTFWTDQAKSWLLLIVLGGTLGSLILYLFLTAGGLAWLYGWGVFVLFNIIILYIAPAWLMPLFYKFEPLKDGELRTRIEEYARDMDFPLKELFVIDGSRRSSKANAFFTGFGKNRRVALYDTLIEKHNSGELVAVLAHEIGHFKLKHIPKMTVLSFLQAGLLFYLAGWFVDSEPLAAAFGVASPSIHTGLVFFGILFSPISRVLSVAVQALSRRHEFEADAFAARTTGAPASLGGALRGLARENLSHLNPHPLYVWLHYSHPPLHERLAALEDQD